MTDDTSYAVVVGSEYRRKATFASIGQLMYHDQRAEWHAISFFESDARFGADTTVKYLIVLDKRVQSGESCLSLNSNFLTQSKTMMRQVSTLYQPPAHGDEMNKLARPAPPVSMFSRTSPKGVEEFGLAMDEVRLDNFHDDMLPAPEELKTLGLAPPTPLSRKRWFRWMCAGLVCATLACIILIASRSTNKVGNELTIENSTQSGVPEISSRIYDTIDFLLKSVDHDHLTNSLSPEFLAARWIADEDGLAMPFSPTFLERYALATLWFSTEGDNWWNNDLFMTDAHHCEWYSTFQTVDKTVFVGVRCNKEQEVTGLVLRK